MLKTITTSFKLTPELKKMTNDIKALQKLPTLQKVLELCITTYHNSKFKDDEIDIRKIEDEHLDEYMLVPLSLYIKQHSISLTQAKQMLSTNELKSAVIGGSIFIIVEFNDRLFHNIELGLLKRDILEIKRELRKK